MTTNPTPEDLLSNLKARPHPKQTLLEMAGGFAYITINGHKIAYDGDRWFACGQQIAPQFSVNSLHQEIDRVFVLAQKMKDDILKTDTKEQTTMTTVSTEQTFVSTDRYRELEAELAKSKDQVYWLSLIGGLYGLSVSNPSKIHEQACKTYNRVSSAGTHVDSLRSQLKAMTASRDEVQKKNDFINGQMSDLLAERERLFEKIKALTEERDRLQASYDYAQNGLHEVWDATGWLEKADNEPCGIEYLKRLKSKADRAGLLSVVCRRLCGDENATTETVHAAIDRCHDESTTLDFIGERLGIDPDGTEANHLGEIRSLVAQTVKSLGEKTVEVAKLQEGLTNYKAHVEGLTKRLEQMTFERDTERIGNKWLSETVEDLKRTTVKLPNEHTLRRLFNRHNTPDKYDDGTPIPMIERFLLIIENLCRNADCAERRFEELNAISTRVNTESEDAHATLDEMGIPRWTTAINNYNERYLSLSARIRSLFTQKV